MLHAPVDLPGCISIVISVLDYFKLILAIMLPFERASDKDIHHYVFLGFDKG